MKLHLGCGKVYLHGWTNVDLFSTVEADLYCDITRLPFPANSADIIYASHVLEHVSRHMVTATLQHWKEILKPSGVLRLAVPNFSAVVSRYGQTGDLAELLGLLYGGQNATKNSHTVIFDEATLVEELVTIGFKRVHKWDWRTTEHAAFDDYSQAFLPHLDRKNGTLMSLNLEAIKP